MKNGFKLTTALFVFSSIFGLEGCVNSTMNLSRVSLNGVVAGCERSYRHGEFVRAIEYCTEAAGRGHDHSYITLGNLYYERAMEDMLLTSPSERNVLYYSNLNDLLGTARDCFFTYLEKHRNEEAVSMLSVIDGLIWRNNIYMMHRLRGINETNL